MALRAVVGLGNPGSEYTQTRHNAGFWFVEHLAAAVGAAFRNEPRFHGDLAKVRYADHDLLLLKPMTFMNRSGQAAQALTAYFKLAPDEILIAHDELDLPAGTMRLKRGGGHGGHNGLRSLHEHLGENYLRLRIGIGHPGHKDRVHGYVLSRPNADDDISIHTGIKDAADALKIALTDGWDKATQKLHTAPDAVKQPKPVKPKLPPPPSGNP